MVINKWRIIIVDDEPLARLGLRHCLNLRHPDFEVVGEAESMLQAWQLLQQDTEIDGVFLDINIETESERAGLDFGFALNNMANPPWVIFVTGYEKHALEAFDIKPVGYLLKPLEQEKIDKNLAWLRKNRPAKDKGNRDALKVRHNKINSYGEIEKHISFFAPQDILYVQKNTGINTVKIRLVQGDVLDGINSTLSEWENRLQAHNFCRISKSSLVNRQHVQYLKMRQGCGSGYRVSFKNCPDELFMSPDYVDKL